MEEQLSELNTLINNTEAKEYEEDLGLSLVYDLGT